MNQENTPSKKPRMRTRSHDRSATASAKSGNQLDSLRRTTRSATSSAKRPPKAPPSSERVKLSTRLSTSTRKAGGTSKNSNARQISFTMADCENISIRLRGGKRTCTNPRINSLNGYERANNNEKHWGMPLCYCILYRGLPVLPSDYTRTNDILDSIIGSHLPPKDYLFEKFANDISKSSLKKEVRNLRKGVKQKIEVGNDMLSDNKLYEALKHGAGSSGGMDAASEATVGTVDEQASGQSKFDEVMELFKQGSEISLNNARNIAGMQEDTKAWREGVKEQFAENGRRLDCQDERLDSHDRRLDRHEETLNQLSITMSSRKLWGPNWENAVEHRYSDSDNKIVGKIPETL